MCDTDREDWDNPRENMISIGEDDRRFYCRKLRCSFLPLHHSATYFVRNRPSRAQLDNDPHVETYPCITNIY